jgi:hypothetical protein
MYIYYAIHFSDHDFIEEQERKHNCRTIKKKKIPTKSKHDMYFDIFEFARNLSCKKNIKEWPFGFI